MMKKALVFALVAAVCVACRPQANDSSDFVAVEGGMRTTPSAPSGTIAPLAAALRTGRVSFASLRDRGDLVEYSASTPPKVDGAYTWHRAEISEAHALQSISSGSMRITSPSGQLLDFAYVRHVEHPSGDWTWVGRLKNGASSEEAVLTFGEQAVFGSIAEPGKPPMRLTTAGGAAWMLETDPRKVAEINNEATRPTKPDYFLPPPQGSAVGAEAPSTTSAFDAPATAGSVFAAAASTVDVVVGYTSGFAASLGGQSQAVTRLNNMVEIANQAYVNSQVDASIRMVHSLQVEYPDNTANGVALESLTGYRAGGGQIPVDPAFTDLRSARERYGGDLVTLVRKFQTPENDGCGIAWLLGGGRTGVDVGDAPFGYSIVSDGVDTGTDGKSYFCRPETLAHELGHNMGSQHDLSTADGEDGVLQAGEYGAYNYSFGYKTLAGSGNFYTVMAYGDSGQVSYRVFSHPGSTFCGGFACGVADSADNARSLRQVIPAVSSFRQAVVGSPRASADFNGDGSSDLLWVNRALSRVEYTLVAGGRYILGSTSFSVPTPWVVYGSAHFDGDVRSDLFLIDESTNQLRIWLNRGNYFEPIVLGGFNSGWQVVALADMSGDGTDDVVFFSPSTARVQITTISNGRMGYSTVFQVPSGYSINFAADVDGSGVKDLVLNNQGTRTVVFWLARGAVYEARTLGGYSAGWALAGFGDINCDGQEDIAWSNDSLGLFEFTRMAGGYSAGSESYFRSPGQRIAAFKKYSGDMCADLLVDNSAAASVASWIRGSDGAGFFNYNLAGYGAGWEVR